LFAAFARGQRRRCRLEARDRRVAPRHLPQMDSETLGRRPGSRHEGLDGRLERGLLGSQSGRLFTQAFELLLIRAPFDLELERALGKLPPFVAELGELGFLSLLETREPRFLLGDLRLEIFEALGELRRGEGRFALGEKGARNREVKRDRDRHARDAQGRRSRGASHSRLPSMPPREELSPASCPSACRSKLAGSRATRRTGTGTTAGGTASRTMANSRRIRATSAGSSSSLQGESASPDQSPTVPPSSEMNAASTSPSRSTHACSRRVPSSRGISSFERTTSAATS